MISLRLTYTLHLLSPPIYWLKKEDTTHHTRHLLISPVLSAHTKLEFLYIFLTGNFLNLRSQTS